MKEDSVKEAASIKDEVESVKEKSLKSAVESVKD